MKGKKYIYDKVSKKMVPLELTQARLAPAVVENSRKMHSKNFNRLGSSRRGMRRCVICGARVRNMNPKTTTCDPICTRARNNGITREEQIQIDIKDEIIDERERYQRQTSRKVSAGD